MPKSSTVSSAKPRSTRPTAITPSAGRGEPTPVIDDSLDGSLEVAPSSTPLRLLPSHEAVAQRAYLLSERRRVSGLPGDEMSDWLQAEAELVAEQA